MQAGSIRLCVCLTIVSSTITTAVELVGCLTEFRGFVVQAVNSSGNDSSPIGKFLVNASSPYQILRGCSVENEFATVKDEAKLTVFASH